ncbi:hypothetical protein GZH53_05325 [Flavihumibacter sp. R14]|nr:hypothetical protein [Flavihumibacter soli]
MKKFLLIAFMATGTLFAQAQTKGTNTLGLGLNFGTTKTDQPSSSSESRNSAFTVGYGHFIKENQKIGINLFYSNYKFIDNEIDRPGVSTYGGTFTYQKYYELFKKLYAFAGPRAGYHYNDENNGNGVTSNMYSLGAYGGISWFVSKRIALEADLLAADINYSHRKESVANSDMQYEYTSTNFGLSTNGSLNGLGFKIYFLF